MTRTFDTPEFRGITFHEVTARSALNKVPEASRMPFRWTINPYRGCSHACVYCAGRHADPDGRRPESKTADLSVGDVVYGTARRGDYRRYVRTDVLAHWRDREAGLPRDAWSDGTTLVTSGDHRFLTERGWKHVTGAEGGPTSAPT